MMYFLYIYCLGQQAPHWHCCPFGYIIGNAAIKLGNLFLQIKSVITVFIAHILIQKALMLRLTMGRYCRQITMVMVFLVWCAMRCQNFFLPFSFVRSTSVGIKYCVDHESSKKYNNLLDYGNVPYHSPGKNTDKIQRRFYLLT